MQSKDVNAQLVFGCQSALLGFVLLAKFIDESATNTMDTPFKIQYAQEIESCRACGKNIDLNVLRLAIMQQSRWNDEKLPHWHHLKCFFKRFHPSSTTVLSGFGKLSVNDQIEIRQHIGGNPAAKRSFDQMSGVIDESSSRNKKPKLSEFSDEPAVDFLQLRDIANLRDEIQKSIGIQMQQSILEENKQFVPNNNMDLLDHLTDVILFGSLPNCTICCKGQFVFDGMAYKCTGSTDWSACCNTVQYPNRRHTMIPAYVLAHHPFLKEVRLMHLKRIVPGPNMFYKRNPLGDHLPLYNMEFFLIGSMRKSYNQIRQTIELMGGTVAKTVHAKLTAIISKRFHVRQMGNDMVKAKRKKIHVVSEDFLEQAMKVNPITYIINNSICSWGHDPTTRIQKDAFSGMNNQQFLHKRFSVLRTQQSLYWSGGGIVDPRTQMEDITHVYVNDVVYSVDLIHVDIVQNKNSYYKIQILESIDRTKYWVFEAWGRISTKIGRTKIQQANDLSTAIQKFRFIYTVKTGNQFGVHFVKVPNHFYHLDTEEATATDIKRQLVESQLDGRLLNIMKLLFDETIMNETLMAFNVDLQLMPLGKIAGLEIAAARTVLNKLTTTLSSKFRTSDHELTMLQLSNKFYSYIPHAFGIRRPEKIDTLELIKAKWKMLNSLEKVRFAYGLLHSTGHLENPFDERYRKLNVFLQPLNKYSADYRMIDEYARNSHAPYHTDYSLEVLDAFAVERPGEKERFAKFAGVGNRMLLWHGSRLANFAGILSNGLRIAPEGVVLTGQYFGKGIYFADMISKSANYTRPQLRENVGLLLLCEVPLGRMSQYKTSARVDPINGIGIFNSVKGIGNTFLDPSKTIHFNNKFSVPLGKPITDNTINSNLLHNEYVVYDEAQVNIKYLVQVKFQWKV